MKRSAIAQMSFLTALIASANAFTYAQPPLSPLPLNETVLTIGLEGPRGLTFGPNGSLYVAEAGVGGTTSTAGLCTDPAATGAGPYLNGPTARISKIDASGSRTTVATGFPSAIDVTNHSVLGVADLAFVEGSLFALLESGGCGKGSATIPASVVKVNLKDGSSTQIADLSGYALAHPVKYPDVPRDFDPEGDFYKMIAYQGRLYVVEANQGQILEIDPEGYGIRRVIDITASEAHIVPTTIAVRESELFLGNLNIFPIDPNTARIIRYAINPQSSFDFERSEDYDDEAYGPIRRLRLVSSKAGFTTIVAIAFGPKDGLLYVLELNAAAGYPTGAPVGKVVRVERDGSITNVAAGLTLPTGMAFDRKGFLYVSNFGGVPANTAPGQIVKIVVP